METMRLEICDTQSLYLFYDNFHKQYCVQYYKDGDPYAPIIYESESLSQAMIFARKVVSNAQPKK